MYKKFKGYQGYKTKFRLLADAIYFGDKYKYLTSECESVLRLADFLEGYVDCLYDNCNLPEIDYMLLLDFTQSVRYEITELM